MAAKGCVLPRAKVAKMMQTARATTEAMRMASLEAYRLRATDPIERAKLALQRAGATVFSHSLHVPGSTLIVVGSKPMATDDFLKHAERFGRW
jgi:hypothetical protein